MTDAMLMNRICLQVTFWRAIGQQSDRLRIKVIPANGDPTQTVKSAIKRSDGLRWPTQYIEPSETTAPSSKKDSAELR
jgi:hypothetical protein